MKWLLPDEAYTDNKKLSSIRAIRKSNKEVWELFLREPIFYVNKWAGDGVGVPFSDAKKKLFHEAQSDKINRIFEDETRIAFIINDYQWLEYEK